MVKKVSYQSRQELLSNIRLKYEQAIWIEKNKILDGFVAATGYERKYAIHLLNRKDNEDNNHSKRGKKVFYDHAVTAALTTLWLASNQLCSKRNILASVSVEMVIIIRSFS